MYYNKEELIKSPLNYTGGKYKLLPQILPLFPDEINTFVDLFGGGGTVFANIKANNIIYNELNTKVYELVKYLYTCNSKEEVQKIEKIITEYGLTKNNKEVYYKLRNDYNTNNDIKLLYILSCYCMNYMIRFNKNLKFNQACGNGGFSEQMKRNFYSFNNCNANVSFHNKSFEELKIDKLSTNDFIYLDPPYFLTVASYNENGGWSEKLEKKLYEFCDELNSKKIKFAMSNVIVYKDKTHELLKEWSKKYNVNVLDFQYTNNNLHGKDLSKKDVEVLITNY